MGLAEDAGLEEGHDGLADVGEQARVEVDDLSVDAAEEGFHAVVGSGGDLLDLHAAGLGVLQLLPELHLRRQLVVERSLLAHNATNAPISTKRPAPGSYQVPIIIIIITRRTSVLTKWSRRVVYDSQ